MSVLDRFLNVIKLNDDEYDEDDYLDEEDPEYDDDPMPKKRVIARREDDMFDDEDDDSSADDKTEAKEKAKVSSVKARTSLPFKAKTIESARVSQFRSSKKRGDSDMRVCVVRPHSMEDAKTITESLLNDCAVILNTEGLELQMAQRIIDFTSGSCCAIDGNLQRISTYIFVITPASIDLSGDFQEVLSGAFDVPFENKY